MITINWLPGDKLVLAFVSRAPADESRAASAQSGSRPIER
jgi:hypothetical protein